MTFVRIIVSVSKLWPSSSYRLLLSMGILYSFSQYISYFDNRKIHFIIVFFISVMFDTRLVQVFRHLVLVKNRQVI
jgi:hypothetical protein